MELTAVQKIMLTVLLGPEDPTAWRRYQQRGTDTQRRIRHREKFLALSSKRYWKNREERLNSARKKYAETPEVFRERSRQWRAKHPEKIRAGLLKWITRRRKSDPVFRLVESMRSRIRNALKDVKKAGRTHELVGCPIPELRAHLEARFVPGMTWENYGPVWHCDHIKPCSRFNLVDPAQQRECFHFSNLQPLFAEDNIRKCDKWDGV